MPNASYVSTGKPKITGAIFRAPLGTPLPTGPTDVLDPAFLELGYVSDDGLTNNNSADNETIHAWGGAPVLNVPGDKTDEFTYKLIEALNPNVLGTVYGDDNVDVDMAAGIIHVIATTEEMQEQVYVIDTILKGGALRRILIPQGALGEVGEIVYKDDEPIGYEITIQAMETTLSGGRKGTHEEWTKLATGADAGITLDKATASVAAGATTALTATTEPEGGRVIWGTSDASVATVDSSGVVTGVSAGSAVITANFGGITATCTVTVPA